MVKRKLLTLIIALTIILLVFVACDDDKNVTKPQTGLIFGGRILLDGEPLSDVSVVSNEVVLGTSDTNGIFMVQGLSKRQKVSFVLDGYTFFPAEYKVEFSVYDVTIVAEVAPSGDASDNQNSQQGDQDANDDQGASDNGQDTEEGPIDGGENVDENPAVDEHESPLPDIRYSCKFAGLQYQNNKINFVFCAEYGFSSLSISIYHDNVTESLEVSAEIGQNVVLGGETILQFSIDVTEKLSENTTYTLTATAKNRDGIDGDSASIEYSPYGFPSQPKGLRFADGILTWSCDDTNSSFLILVDGVVVGDTTDYSFDLSSFNLHADARLRVVSQKDGYVDGVSAELII